MTQSTLAKRFIIGSFVTLYIVTSLISTIHTVEFFRLSNPNWLAVTLAVAFEIGAAASLASLIALDKMRRGMVWVLFILLTAIQINGNTYYAYNHLHDFNSWIELFGLTDYDLITQKRIMAIISGAILPIIALGFIKSLVDYITPDTTKSVEEETPSLVIEEPEVVEEPPLIAEDAPPPVLEEEHEPVMEPEVVTEEVPELEDPEKERLLKQLKVFENGNHK